MLVLTRRPGESLILTFPDELGLEPVEISVFEGGKIGIDEPEEIEILRSELLTS